MTIGFQNGETMTIPEPADKYIEMAFEKALSGKCFHERLKMLTQTAQTVINGERTRAPLEVIDILMEYSQKTPNS